MGIGIDLGSIGKIAGGIVGTYFGGPIGAAIGVKAGEAAGNLLSGQTASNNNNGTDLLGSLLGGQQESGATDLLGSALNLLA